MDSSRCRNILIFQILLPWCLRLSTLCSHSAVIQFLVDNHYHPETANAATVEKLLVYFLGFLLIDFMTSLLAFSWSRGTRRTRATDGCCFTCGCSASATGKSSRLCVPDAEAAVEGRPFNWEKIERTARMSRHTEKIAAGD